MLKYALRKNMLTAKDNDHLAQIIDSRSYSLSEVIDRMVERGSSLTRVDITAAIELYTEVLSAIIADGGIINTPLVTTSWGLKGVFDGKDDRYDASRHSIQCKMHPGSSLKGYLRKIKIEKVMASDTSPFISDLHDAVSKEALERCSAGSTVQITGAKLKFNEKDSEQGLFFISEENKEFRCTSIIENRPARIIFIIPESLPPGDYHLEIRCTATVKEKERKKLKTGRFEQILIITERTV